MPVRLELTTPWGDGFAHLVRARTRDGALVFGAADEQRRRALALRQAQGEGQCLNLTLSSSKEEGGDRGSVETIGNNS